jgi:type IV pilus assembly protein PilX
MTRSPLSQGMTARRHQSGVVLIVAMVMLVIIGLASVAIMRNALNTDLISDNSRRQNQALQAAQAALRFCEGQIVAGLLTPATAITDATTQKEDWQTLSNWYADTNTSRRVVTTDFIAGSTQTDAPSFRPQCMAQTRTVGSGASASSVVVITARGFSSNYAEDATSRRSSAGSVVWLQSILQLAGSDEG